MRSKNASRSVSQRKPSSVSAPGIREAAIGIHSAAGSSEMIRSATRYACGLARSN
jgi:hypothetical protein